MQCVSSTICAAFLATLMLATTSLADFQPVDINQASKEQLAALPGIGNKLAKRIVDYREQHGSFALPQDLAKVEGIKPGIMAKVASLIVAGRNRRLKKVAAQVAAEQPSPQMTDAQIAALIKSFHDEPSVREVQQQAVAYAKMQPSIVDSWMKRARKAPWLPNFGTRVGRRVLNALYLRGGADDSGIVSQRGNAEFVFDVRAEWRLSELVFNRDELRTAMVSMRLTSLRERVLQNVTKLYFERRRLQVINAASPSADALEREQDRLRIDELTADLDSVTGGWFSERVEHAP